jgi:hypothetical protein
MRTLQTEILIHAPAERVWRVLTDFAAHPAWDPFFASIAGELSTGARLRVQFRQNGMRMRPRVTEVLDGRVLEWLGSLGVRGLFDGRHRFELSAEGASTRLRHGERFSGILVPLFGRVLDKTAGGFEAFNEAIKARAEGTEWEKSAA